MILLTNSYTGEPVFRILLEDWGDMVTSRERAGYTATYIDANRKLQ
jgi:hypothetical protein